MRPVERIDRILALIGEIWHTYPDMRLGQLLVNSAPKFETNTFSFEDEALEAKLQHVLKDGWME